MIWVAVILGMLLMTLLVVAVAAIALKCLQESAKVSQQFISAHAETLKTLEAVHDKNIAQTSGVLDRFMALDFSLFKSYQLSESADIGGFEPPEEENLEGGFVTFTPMGREVHHGASMNDRLAAAANERALIAEDFPPGFDE